MKPLDTISIALKLFAAFILAATSHSALADGLVVPGHSVPRVTFPTITSSDLNGRSVTLPNDLQGEKRLLLLAYDRKDQKIVDPWINMARQWKLPEERLGIYEIPIIQDPGKFMREFIDVAMKRGIPEADVRRRVITLYTNKDALLDKLAIENDKTIDILLIDADGYVLWRTEGSLTAEKQAALELAITRG